MDSTKAESLIEDQPLAEIVHRLIKAYCPERIYLFGSRSRKDSGSNRNKGFIEIFSPRNGK